MNPLATVMLIFKSDIGQQNSFRSTELVLKSFNIYNGVQSTVSYLNRSNETKQKE